MSVRYLPLQQLAQAAGCPRCAVPAGRPCLELAGAGETRPHVERIDRAAAHAPASGF